jgi:hypothetical protein
MRLFYSDFFPLIAQTNDSLKIKYPPKTTSKVIHPTLDGITLDVVK